MIRVRVISLRDSTERRAAMAAQLDTVPALDWSFVDAHTAPPSDLPYDDAGARRTIRRPLSRGEQGCFASHVALWRWLVAQPQGTILVVLEDDLIIDPNSLPNCPPYVRQRRLTICGSMPRRRLRRACAAASPAVTSCRYRGLAFGTQAYVLRQAGAARWLASISRMIRPVDDEIDRYWAHGVANMGLFPFPVIERSGPSTIEMARRQLPPPRWHELGWQLRRLRESAWRRWANLQSDLKGQS